MSASIRTPDQRLRVFVSSTLQELAEEREATREAIQHLRLTPVMFEMGARAHPPRDLYRAYLTQSDVFVGLYWQRYGWIAPDETISGLEDEYRLAGRMPKLIYIKRADQRDDRLKVLIGRIRDEDSLSYRPFSDAAELKDLIANDLALMLTEHFTTARMDAGSVSQVVSSNEVLPRSLAPVERVDPIGRAPQVERVTALLRRPDVGLITLTGPGGIGKTRLAVHFANRYASWFKDGAHYVPLAAVRSAQDVVSTIVSTLEIPVPASGADPETLLLGFLRARRALLVLDNFEQVLAAADDVGKLHATCPHLKILVTSREPLRIRGEWQVPIPPLPHDLGTSGTTPAMELFETRALEVRPEFRIDDENRAAVIELCRRLDALPLAIELAAARVRVLSPQAMVPRLQQSLSLLRGGKRDLPTRHQTLRATLDWSLDLLAVEERVFFRRLGVFAGSFSEDAAAAVVAEAGLDTLDGLTSLVEKNLLVRTEVRGEARFHMLETVRELAREEVAEAGEERAARLRYAEWIVMFQAGEQESLMHWLRQAAHERIALEDAATQESLRFAAGPDGDRELAWRLFVHSGFARLNNGQTADVLASYEMLQGLDRSEDPLRAALVLGVWSWARAAMLDVAAEPDLAAACAVIEGASERDFLTSILTAWGMLLIPTDRARALANLDRAVVLAREAGQPFVEVWALTMICYAHLHYDAMDDARLSADELEEIGRRRGDEECVAYALTVRARVSLAEGDFAASRNLFAEAAARARARSAAWPRSMALCGLASVTFAAGDDVGARAVLEETLYFCSGVGYVGIDCLCGTLALLLDRAGERDRALRVFGAVAAGAENETDYRAVLADPSGALRAATRDARARLGDPSHGDPAAADLDAVLRAALGTRR